MFPSFGKPFKSFFIRMRFQDILFVTAILMTMLFLITLSLQTLISSQKYIIEKTTETNKSNLYQTGIMLENKLFSIKKLTEFVSTDDNLLNKLIIYKEAKAGEKSSLVQNITSYLERTKYQNEQLTDIILLTKTSLFSTSRQTDFFQKDFTDTINKYLEHFKQLSDNEDVIFLTPQKPDKSNKLLQEELSLTANSYAFISLLIKDDKLLGILITRLASDFFNLSISQNNSIVLLNSQNEVVWSGISDENSYSYPNKNSLINSDNASNASNTDNTGNAGNTSIADNASNAGNSGNSGNSGNAGNTSNADNASNAGNSDNTGNTGNTGNASDISKYIRNTYQMDLFDKHFLLILLPNKNTDNYNYLRTVIIIAFLISIVMSLIFSKLISKKITLPIKNLVKSIVDYRVRQEAYNYNNSKNGFRITIRESILYYLIGVIVIPVFVFTSTTYLFSTRMISIYVTEAYTRVFNQMADNISTYLEMNIKVMKNIIYNDLTQASLQKKALISESEIIRFIDRSVQLTPGKESITIFDNQAKLFFSNNLPYHYTADNMKKVLELFSTGNESMLWYKSSKDLYNRAQLNIFLRIKSLEQLNVIGYLHCEIDERDLDSFYINSLYEGISIYITDSSNVVISHSDKNMINVPVSQNKYNSSNLQNISHEFYQVSRKLGDSPWILVGQYPYSLLSKDLSTLLNEKIYIFTIMIFIIMFMSFILSYSLTKPLGLIQKLISSVKVDNMEILFPEESSIQEINDLGKAFNDMILRIETLIDNLVLSTSVQGQLKEQKKEAELVALQAQINPHFLYNTFDSIKWMIKYDNKMDAAIMLDNLSSLLRYTAKSSEPIVTIAEEIEYVKYYAWIMKKRFGENLNFLWEFEPEIMDNPMIRLTLQPIVENAIYHGIQPKRNSGVIKIYGYSDKKVVVLRVEDNGIGILPDAVKALQKSLREDNSHKKIGLHNVQSRIRLFFGNDYGISVSSIIGEKTIVEMHIPVKNYLETKE